MLRADYFVLLNTGLFLSLIEEKIAQCLVHTGCHNFWASAAREQTDAIGTTQQLCPPLVLPITSCLADKTYGA